MCADIIEDDEDGADRELEGSEDDLLGLVPMSYGPRERPLRVESSHWHLPAQVGLGPDKTLADCLQRLGHKTSKLNSLSSPATVRRLPYPPVRPDRKMMMESFGPIFSRP